MVTNAVRMTLASLILGLVASAAETQTPASSADQQASEFREHWPQGRAAVFRLKDDLILAIPPQFQKFWQQGPSIVREPISTELIPQISSIGFSFFLPDFSGFTPGNYLHEYDENLVEVTSIEPADPKAAEPDAPGSYPPNVWKRSLAGLLDRTSPLAMYGLSCYRWLPAVSPDTASCYGQRDKARKEDIVLWVNVPPYQAITKFPMMQAKYYSGRFGGVKIVWRTSAKNLPRWAEIDAHIWKSIDAWNIAASKN